MRSTNQLPAFPLSTWITRRLKMSYLRIWGEDVLLTSAVLTNRKGYFFIYIIICFATRSVERERLMVQPKCFIKSEQKNMKLPWVNFSLWAKYSHGNALTSSSIHQHRRFSCIFEQSLISDLLFPDFSLFLFVASLNRRPFRFMKRNTAGDFSEPDLWTTNLKIKFNGRLRNSAHSDMKSY